MQIRFRVLGSGPPLLACLYAMNAVYFRDEWNEVVRMRERERKHTSSSKTLVYIHPKESSLISIIIITMETNKFEVLAHQYTKALCYRKETHWKLRMATLYN